MLSKIQNFLETELGTAIRAVLWGALILFIIKVAFKKIKIRFSESKKNNISNNIEPDKDFVNREECSETIIEEIEEGNSPILFKVVGTRGIGKTEFGKVINSLINNPHTLSSLDNLMERLPDNTDSFFIDAHSKSYIQDEILECLNWSQDRKEEKNVRTVSKFLLKKSAKNPLFFIFDTIDDEDKKIYLYNLYDEINKSENKIYFMMIYSSSLLNKTEDSSVLIELKGLSIKAIDQLLKKQGVNNVLPDKILQLTHGIPTLIKITMHYFKDKDSNSKLEGLNNITELLSVEEQVQLQKLIVCSMTSRNNQINMVYLAKGFDGNGAPQCTDLVKKFFVTEKTSDGTSLYYVPSLITEIFFKQHHDQISVKMEELIKNHGELGGPRIFYEILLGAVNSDFSFIEELLQKKDYTVILNVFRLFKENSKAILSKEIKEETISELLYYFTEALIGAGEYDVAAGLADEYEFSRFYTFRKEKSEKLLLQYSNLLHLQNKYELAITGYQEVKRNGSIEAYWGIGHCLRHQGKIQEALEVYHQTIRLYGRLSDECKNTQRSFYIKSLNEANSISIYNNCDNIKDSWELIDAEIQNLPCAKQEVAKLSTNKYKALYYSNVKKDFEKAMELIESTLEIYEEKKERLRFNLYFEKGEILKKSKLYKESVTFFEKSLRAANYNGDKNIIIYSTLGIISSEILANNYLHFKDDTDRQDAIEKCFSLCYDDKKEVNFVLAKKHTIIIQDILNGKTKSDCLRTMNLPLF